MELLANEAEVSEISGADDLYGNMSVYVWLSICSASVLFAPRCTLLHCWEDTGI